MAVAAANKKGIKRICMGCGTRFYDFNKRPIICPSCGAEFTGDVKAKSRRGRAAADDGQVKKPAKSKDNAEDQDDEDDIEDDEDEDMVVSLDDVDEMDDDEDDLDLDMDEDIDDLDDLDDDSSLEDELDAEGPDGAVDEDED